MLAEDNFFFIFLLSGYIYWEGLSIYPYKSCPPSYYSQDLSWVGIHAAQVLPLPNCYSTSHFPNFLQTCDQMENLLTGTIETWINQALFVCWKLKRLE
jgi:hypothetical protein